MEEQKEEQNNKKDLMWVGLAIGGILIIWLLSRLIYK